LAAASLKKTQPALAYAAGHLDEDVSLTALAGRAGLSPHHFHRAFSDALGETPKQLMLRLRLGRASAMLLTGGDSVLDVALACGFQSHEVFSRAFRRRFGMTPTAYRKRGFAGEVGAAHAEMVERIGPCVGLYQTAEKGRARRNDMVYSITKKELEPQPVLVVRRRVKRSEIAATIGAVLPGIFVYAQQHGIALAGLPFTRYVEVGAGLLTIEPGMRIASGSAAGAGEIVADTLPGGPAASTIHTGPYEQLPDAYGALQQWIETEGLAVAGAPWEAYLNDPSDHPDPKDWKTEIFWPVSI
jgi:AraC family transcriptional regulator